MGLSASQARLLSITQRLSDNELHSEIIANSKMRLADDGVAAKNKYVNALNSTKLQYVGFDGYGNANSVDLTFNSLMNYSEIKNQNILRNSNGQVLISDIDAYNYETSRDMYEFVSRYCGENYEEYLEQLEEYEAWQSEYGRYQEEHNAWLEEYHNYLADYAAYEGRHAEYLALHADWEREHEYWENVLIPDYEEKLEYYNAYSSSVDLHQTFVNIVGTSDYNSDNPPLTCYDRALRYPLGDCYVHLLTFLLRPIGEPELTDSEMFQTSLMDSDGNYVNVESVEHDWYHSNIDSFMGGNNQLLEIYQAMNKTTSNGTPIYLCDSIDEDIYGDGYTNLIQHALDSGRKPYDWEVLMSDYQYNYETGECVGLKSLRQKAIDMLELIKNRNIYLYDASQPLPGDPAAIMTGLLINFTDGDMAKLDLEEPVYPPEPEEPMFTEDPPEFNVPEPEYPPEPPVPEMHFQNKSFVQWYINLWHAIDGQDDPNELRAIYDEEGVFSYYTAENKQKLTRYDSNGNVLNPSYEIIRDELRPDSNWLKTALANGIVTLDQMILDSNENRLVWQGLEYTSTSSFVEVQDDKKIAQAEAEYQTEMKRIEIEDTKLDMKIKKLDAEHNALKTEYESVAQLIGKNVERSYNTFNA